MFTEEELPPSQSTLLEKLKHTPVKPALYQSKSESMLTESELPKFTSLGTTGKNYDLHYEAIILFQCVQRSYHHSHH